MIRLIDNISGSIIVNCLVIRSTFLGKLRGFSFFMPPVQNSAMLFPNTRIVHTFGMFFPLDIHFFDSSMKYIRSSRNVKPNRFLSSPKGTRHILEIPSINPQSSVLFRHEEQLSIIIEAIR